MKVKVKKLYPDVKLPEYALPGDAGMDMFSREDFELNPGTRHNFKLGFALEFPEGNVAIVKDKGGPPHKFGLHTMGGVFDSGFRGEYNIELINLSTEPYQVKKGDKLAQLIIYPYDRGELEEVDELAESARGGGQFGSTGR